MSLFNSHLVGTRDKADDNTRSASFSASTTNQIEGMFYDFLVDVQISRFRIGKGQCMLPLL